MPLEYTTAVRKTYTVDPIPRSFIASNGKTQAQILWIGCSDSSILETDCLGVEMREEMFVHRNLGNILSNGDLSTESALEWCVGLLKVCFPFPAP